jgi:hypothetical protein
MSRYGRICGVRPVVAGLTPKSACHLTGLPSKGEPVRYRPMISEKFIYIGALFNLMGSSTYAVSTVRGHTKPNRVSWFVWSLAAFVAFSAQVSQGVGLRSLTTFMVGFGPLVIFLVSFVNRKSYWRVTKFDLACGGFSLLALVLWQVTGIGNVAIALSIAADVLATVPTLRKGFKYPASEHPLPFLTGFLSAGITLLTLKAWSFSSGGFALYILLVSGALFALVYFKLGSVIRERFRTHS